MELMTPVLPVLKSDIANFFSGKEQGKRNEKSEQER